MRPPQIRLSNGFVLKKKTLILQLVIVFLLTSIALWDAVQILNSYINDNRYTLVKVFPTDDDDAFPFLENANAQLSFHYDEDTLFREFWTNDTAKKEALDLYDPKVALDNFATFAKEGHKTTKMSLNDRFGAAMLFEDVRNLDFYSMGCAVNRDNDSCSKITTFSFLDNVLENNASSLEAFRNKLWLNVQPNILRGVNSIELDGSPNLSLLQFDASSVDVDVPFSLFLKPKSRTFRLAAGPFGDFAWVFQNSTLEPMITVSFTSDSLPVILAKRAFTLVTVMIENVGIFDKRETTECTEEPPIEFMRLQPISECEYREYLKITVALCNCTPFSLRQERLITILNYKQFASCSANSYKLCMQNIQKAMATAPSCQPCLTRKNHYSISTTTYGEEKYGSDMCDWSATSNESNADKCARAQIRFRCNDVTYTIYEERFLLSASQLVAQIGGGIGLYTGISVLGMWQFLAFAYNLYQRIQTKRASVQQNVGDDTAADTASGQPSENVVMMLIHRLTGTKETEKDGRSNRVAKDSTIIGMEAKLNELKDFIAKVDNKTEITRSDIIEIKDRQHQMMQRMEELFVVMERKLEVKSNQVPVTVPHSSTPSPMKF